MTDPDEPTRGEAAVIEAVLDLIEGTSETRRRNLRDVYLSQFGQAIVPHCIARFRKCRQAPVRSDLVRFLIRYGPESEEVVDFGLEALADRSRVVRESACALLAYSGSRRALPALGQRAKADTGDPAARAVAAIESGDPDRFYPDYDHWIVSQDDPAQPNRESVERCFERSAPELVGPLRRIFGDPYAKWQA